MQKYINKVPISPPPKITSAVNNNLIYENAVLTIVKGNSFTLP